MQDIIIYGIALIIILVAIICFIVTMRRQKGKEGADEFIYGLSDEMVKMALEIIGNFNPADYDSIEEFESTCLSNIYTKLWEYVSQQAKEKLEDGNILKLVFQYIDADAVIKVIDKIFTEQEIFAKVENRYAEYNLENKQEVPEANYSESEYFENEEAKPEDLEPATLVTDDNGLKYDDSISIVEEAPVEINPPREEGEEEFNIEDDSMEIIPDPEEKKSTIIVSTDKNGKERYYEIQPDGKKKQVKKDYALSIMDR